MGIKLNNDNEYLILKIKSKLTNEEYVVEFQHNIEYLFEYGLHDFKVVNTEKEISFWGYEYEILSPDIEYYGHAWMTDKDGFKRYFRDIHLCKKWFKSKKFKSGSEYRNLEYEVDKLKADIKLLEENQEKMNRGYKNGN